MCAGAGRGGPLLPTASPHLPFGTEPFVNGQCLQMLTSIYRDQAGNKRVKWDYLKTVGSATQVWLADNLVGMHKRSPEIWNLI